MGETRVISRNQPTVTSSRLRALMSRVRQTGPGSTSTPMQTPNHRPRCLCHTSPKLRPPTAFPPWWSRLTPDARRACSTATPAALSRLQTHRGAPKGGLFSPQRTTTSTGISVVERVTLAPRQIRLPLPPHSCPVRPLYCAPSPRGHKQRWELCLQQSVVWNVRQE